MSVSSSSGAELVVGCGAGTNGFLVDVGLRLSLSRRPSARWLLYKDMTLSAMVRSE